MKLSELDAHPLMEAFRQKAPEVVAEENAMYHLLLPPEYNIPADMLNPLLYLFFERQNEQGVFIQYNNEICKLKCENDKLTPISGFDHNETVLILQTTPCTTANGFAFDMHEIGSNPFMPSPIPPLCDEIENGYQKPSKAIDFLRSRIRSEKIGPLLDEIESFAAHTVVSPKTIQQIVSVMQKYMDKICDAIFEVRPFHFIPTIFKMKTNFIIFYAITNLFHHKLLKAYHESLREENAIACRAVRHQAPSKANSEQLDIASDYLKNLQNMSSIAEGIQMVSKFFEGVVAALPGKNAAADDILPAVCDGMSRCRPLSTHLVSSFQYLAEVWPQEGLSEKTTYILVTCSIAASHFGSGMVDDDESNQENQNENSSSRRRRMQNDIQAPVDETIQMLEDYLDTLDDVPAK